MGIKMIGPTFILDHAFVVNLADEFPRQGDSGLIEGDPTLLLHLLDERLVRRIDPIIASKVIPLNVIGTAKGKIST